MTKRGQHQDSVYFDHQGTDCRDAAHHRSCTGRWRGEVSLGHDGRGKRVRRKVSGRTKTETYRKLGELHDELDSGVRTSATYTVKQAVDDWLKNAMSDRAPKTIKTLREILTPLLEILGQTVLRELEVADVRLALTELAATRSTRTVRDTRAALVRAITYAQASGRASRNVAVLVKVPPGKGPGRPSKSLTLAQAVAVLDAARSTRLDAYVALSLLTGIRTEEARALRWDHVDLDGDPPTVAVWRSVRAHGDVKTQKSRRTLALPRTAVEALRRQQERQAQDRALAGVSWQDSGLVIASKAGTQLDAANVRRGFRAVCRDAGIGPGWSPRELRHSFVSMMSASGVPVEEIARLVGHSGTTVTERVYRRELRPVITTGAEVMDRILKPRPRRTVTGKPRRTVTGTPKPE